MKVLVTGGAGFIGSHVVEKLLERGIAARVLDLKTPSVDGPVERFRGSVTERESVERAIEGCDAVIHLAALANVDEVERYPAVAESVNVRGTLNVLEAARESGIRRVVYASTIWVYSDCAETAVDEETVPAAPQHLYTATKLAGEMYCKAYRELYGVEFTILRFGIPFGPRARDGAVIRAFVDRALADEPLTVAGSGDQSRRFVYVEDLAEGIVCALQPAAANRVYNLASRESVSILEVAETVQAVLGGSEIVHTQPRNGDFPGKEVSTQRAAHELGWTASTPFAEGVRRYAEWYEAQRVEHKSRALRTKHRVRLRPRRVWRLMPGRGLVAAAAAAVILFSALFASGDSYTLIARALDLRPMSSVPTDRNQVALMVDSPPRMVPNLARGLSAHHLRASFALSRLTAPDTIETLKELGDEPIPKLLSGEPLRWIGTTAQLKRTARHLGLAGRFFYSIPGKGFTLGQYVLGRVDGATAVAPSARFTSGEPPRELDKGDVVELVAGQDQSEWRVAMRSLASELHDRGLEAVPVAVLAGGG